MHLTGYLIIVLLTAFTGWAVAKLSLSLLFYPNHPIRFFGYGLQGIVPKHKQSFGTKAGNWVATELFSFDAIEKKIANPASLAKLRPEIELHIDHFLRVKLKEVFPMLFNLIGDKTIGQLKTAFLAELEILFPVLMTNYVQTLKEEFDLGKIIAATIDSFSTEKLILLVYKNFGKQIRQLQMAGFFIGLFVGGVQVITIYFFMR